jgi:hypothetical protein
MSTDRLGEPWRSFFHGIDAQLAGSTEIHRLGAFVVSEYYGLARPTADVDIIQVRGALDIAGVQRVGGKSSVLAKKYRVNARRSLSPRVTISRTTSRRTGAVTLFSQHLTGHLDFQEGLREQFLESMVFGLELFQPLGAGHAHAAEFAPPQVVAALGEPVLAAQILHGHARVPLRAGSRRSGLP